MAPSPSPGQEDLYRAFLFCRLLAFVCGCGPSGQAEAVAVHNHFDSANKSAPPGVLDFQKTTQLDIR